MSLHGVCKISTLDKEEKFLMQSFEKALRKEKILENNESIKWLMKEASLNDTIGEMENVINLGP